MSRLPTSLNWLIEKRGRIDGSIQKIERYLEKNRHIFERYQSLIAELSLLKETLESVDTALQLHKLQIDPQNIPVINGRNPVTGIPHGELSRLIMERVKMGSGTPVSSKEVVDFIVIKRRESGSPPMARAFLSDKVSNRLNGLHRQGNLIRHHSPRSSHHGLWTLAEH